MFMRSAGNCSITNSLETSYVPGRRPDLMTSRLETTRFLQCSVLRVITWNIFNLVWFGVGKNTPTGSYILADSRLQSAIGVRQSGKMYHLDQHWRSVHEGMKYPCGQCLYQATLKESLTRHKRAIHEGIKNVCKKQQRKEILQNTEDQIMTK